MPANLSPEYKEAQEAFRRARDPQERLEHLREMLRTMPKHKGTEHLQAEIRTRIKELTEELAAPKRAGVRTGPPLSVRPEGAAQVALLGPPNVGKSLLHARLTGSHAVVGPYPFATKFPLPGMLPFQDIHIQLVDLPPISADFMEPWMVNALQHADGSLLVVDLGDPACVEQVAGIRRRLEEKRVHLLRSGGANEEEPLDLQLATALVANRSDLLTDPRGELEVFRQLAGISFPVLAVSAETGQGLGEIGPLLFEMLGIVRVYPKLPGHPPDKSRPFTLRRRDTVREVARLIHRGRAEELKYARLWGSARFDGEQVSASHPLQDGDIVELHW